MLFRLLPGRRGVWITLIFVAIPVVFVVVLGPLLLIVMSQSGH